MEDGVLWNVLYCCFIFYDFWNNGFILCVDLVNMYIVGQLFVFYNLNVILYMINFFLYNKRCLFIRFLKKDVLIQYDYNDIEEIGIGGIFILLEIDVFCYYY